MATVNKAPRRACLSWHTDDEVEHSLKQDTGISEKAGLSVGEPFGMVQVETLQGRVNIMKEIHTIASATERILWPFRRFYLSRI